jgi:response regulator NasT
MNRIVVAFESDSSRRHICEMLESSGIVVRGSFRSGSEVIRMVRKMGGGIVICGFKLPEMTASDIAYDLKGSSAFILIVAPPPLLELCENPEVYKLPTHVSKRDLLASIRMLIQIEEKHLRVLCLKGPAPKTQR